MKQRVYLMLIGLFIWTVLLTAQEVPSGLTNAFKRGSVQELAPFLGDKVEVIILKNSQDCNKEEAKKTIGDFFATNKVNSFTVNHQGKRNESSFIVGTFITSGGTYRINCFFKKSGDQSLIHQIRIDKTNE